MGIHGKTPDPTPCDLTGSWKIHCLVDSRALLQSQSLIIPMLWSSIATLLLHILFCWLLVFKISLGYFGAALAITVSYWLNVFMLVAYIRFSNSCKETFSSPKKDAFSGVAVFMRLALPSALMIWPLFFAGTSTQSRAANFSSFDLHDNYHTDVYYSIWEWCWCKENNTSGGGPNSWEALWKKGMKMKAMSCWIQSRQTLVFIINDKSLWCSPGMETTWWLGEYTPRDVLTGTW